MKKIIAILSLLSFFTVVPTMAAQACSTTASAGSIKVGGAISGGSVVVCGTATAAKTTTAKTVVAPKPAPVPVKKVVAPPPPPCVITVSSPPPPWQFPPAGCTYKVVLPTPQVLALPKPVVVAAPKPVTPVVAVKSSTAVTSASDQAAFTPNPVGVNSANDIGATSQTFFFSADAFAHNKLGTVLGSAADVSFVPIGYSWTADNGVTGTGSSFSAAWPDGGQHNVTLTVTYAASYLVAGGSWVSVGTITASAGAAVTVVAFDPPPPVKTKAAPLLVFKNCLLKPTGYRCP